MTLSLPDYTMRKWVEYEQIFKCALVTRTLPAKLPNNKHHRVPRSRCHEWGLSPSFDHNIIHLTNLQHNAWHQLFGNFLAEEVITLLNRGWSPRTDGQLAAFKLLFPMCTDVSKVEQKLWTRWSIRHDNPKMWVIINEKLRQGQ